MPNFRWEPPDLQEEQSKGHGKQYQKVEKWEHSKAVEILADIEAMIQARVESRRERIQWCGEFLSFQSTSSVIIPAGIVNACCARFLVQDSKVSDRGLCVYNPGGRSNPDTTTICLVLGPMQKETTLKWIIAMEKTTAGSAAGLKT